MGMTRVYKADSEVPWREVTLQQLGERREVWEKMGMIRCPGPEKKEVLIWGRGVEGDPV